MTSQTSQIIFPLVSDSYSVYDAKARLSEIVRRVREGATITITYRGKPVAVMRPVEERRRTLEEHVRWLEETGQLVRRDPRGLLLKPIARRPGALKRFLQDRSRF